mgnify:CR=1 FL=1
MLAPSRTTIRLRKRPAGDAVGLSECMLLAREARSSHRISPNAYTSIGDVIAASQLACVTKQANTSGGMYSTVPILFLCPGGSGRAECDTPPLGSDVEPLEKEFELSNPRMLPSELILAVLDGPSLTSFGARGVLIPKSQMRMCGCSPTLSRTFSGFKSR